MIWFNMIFDLEIRISFNCHLNLLESDFKWSTIPFGDPYCLYLISSHFGCIRKVDAYLIALSKAWSHFWRKKMVSPFCNFTSNMYFHWSYHFLIQNLILETNKNGHSLIMGVVKCAMYGHKFKVVDCIFESTN